MSVITLRSGKELQEIPRMEAELEALGRASKMSYNATK